MGNCVRRVARSKVGNGNHTNGKFAEVLEILENDIQVVVVGTHC